MKNVVYNRHYKYSSEYLLFSIHLLLGPQPGVELPLGTAEADAGGGPEAGWGG